MRSETRATDWLPIGAATGTTNSAALTTSANKAPTATRPATDEAAGRFVVDLHAKSLPQGELAEAVHYDVGFLLQDANNEAAGYRVWQWRPHNGLWIPRLLIAGVATAGARVGIAGQDPDETWFFADTITATYDGTRGASVEIDSDPDGVAALSFDAHGSGLIEIELSVSTAAAVRPMVAAL